MRLLSRSDLFNRGALEVFARSALRPPDQRISREAVFTEGTDINILLAGASAMGDQVMQELAAHCAAQLLDSAEGEDLDRVVYDRYHPFLARKQPAAALVPLRWSRPNPAGGAINLPVGYRVRTVRGTEFALVQPLAIPAGGVTPVTVSAQAVATGAAGNVALQTITQAIAVFPDPDLSVTNLEPATGGADTEGDASLRARARAFWKTARRGVLGAIQLGASSTPGVASANVIEELDATGRQTGRVFCYVADIAGQGNSVLAAAVRTNLLEYRAAGIYVDVFGSLPRFEDIIYRLRYKPGTDSAAAFAEVQFLTVARVNALMPGETLPRSLLFEAARRVPGTIVLDDAVVEPAGDIVPVGAEIIKTSPELVTAV